MKFRFVVLTADERIAIATACGHRLQTTACPTPTVTLATAQIRKGGARVAQASHRSPHWPVINVWYHRVVGFQDLHGRGCVCTGDGGVRVFVCVPEDVPTI